jgi:hypothetical protein
MRLYVGTDAGMLGYLTIMMQLLTGYQNLGISSKTIPNDHNSKNM